MKNQNKFLNWDSSYPNHILAGLRIFKQNWGNSNKIRMVERSARHCTEFTLNIGFKYKSNLIF